MNPVDSLRIRKRKLAEPGFLTPPLPSNEIDLVACATILFSAEDASHPIEHLLDGRSGRGATRWTSGRQSAGEEIVIEFDEPQHIARVMFDAEELETERTQQVTMEFSTDGGATYRTALVQDYTFSPHGSTYQREDLGFNLRGVTHVRLIVIANKAGHGAASLTSLRLFS